MEVALNSRSSSGTLGIAPLPRRRTRAPAAELEGEVRPAASLARQGRVLGSSAGYSGEDRRQDCGVCGCGGVGWRDGGGG